MTIFCVYGIYGVGTKQSPRIPFHLPIFSSRAYTVPTLVALSAHCSAPGSALKNICQVKALIEQAGSSSTSLSIIEAPASGQFQFGRMNAARVCLVNGQTVRTPSSYGRFLEFFFFF